MRRLFASLFLFATSSALAAPFIACDLDARATHTQMQTCTTINSSTSPPSCATWGAWSADVAAVTVGAAKECRHDAAASVTGTNIVRVRAVDVNGWAGREESAPSAPFVYTRPAFLQSPSAIRVVP